MEARTLAQNQKVEGARQQAIAETNGSRAEANAFLQPPEHSKSTRLRLAVFGVEHAYDHYGQIVEYLRMNGIVPPASR